MTGVGICELEAKAIEFTQFEQQRENRWKKNEQSLRDNNKRSKIHISIWEGERVSLKDYLKKIMAENFPKFCKRHNLTNLRSWVNPKYEKKKKNPNQ